MAFTETRQDRLQKQQTIHETVHGGNNAAIDETTGAVDTPRRLDRVIVTFHNNADPAVQQSVTNETVTITVISGIGTSGIFDRQLTTSSTVSGKNYIYTTNEEEWVHSSDKLKVEVTAPGASVYTSVMVIWSTRD